MGKSPEGRANVVWAGGKTRNQAILLHVVRGGRADWVTYLDRKDMYVCPYNSIEGMGV